MALKGGRKTSPSYFSYGWIIGIRGKSETREAERGERKREKIAKKEGSHLYDNPCLFKLKPGNRERLINMQCGQGDRWYRSEPDVGKTSSKERIRLQLR